MFRDFAYSSGTHHCEITIYSIFFHQLRQILQKKGLRGEDLSLDVPDFYYVHLEDNVSDEVDGSGTCTLMEDLVDKGFRMVDKHGGYDNDHVRLSLDSLAKYHALTIASLNEWKDQDGKVIYSTEVEFLKGKTFYNDLVHMYNDFLKPIATRFKLIERPDMS